MLFTIDGFDRFVIKPKNSHRKVTAFELEVLKIQMKVDSKFNLA
jgi:hypothetical protein